MRPQNRIYISRPYTSRPGMTTITSKFPTRTVGSPNEALDFVLSSIISASPEIREAKVKPYLRTFLSHPVIKELLGHDEAPVQASNPPANLELQQIQDSLKSLSKAIENLKRDNPPSKIPTKPSRNKQQSGERSKHAQHTYSAVAGSRPPNPSLVVDLAHLDLPAESRPRPEYICDTLNKKLGEVTPPQAQLAAARWTAKGNLVITAGPASTPASLLSAAPHINAILSTTLKLTSHSPFTQPRANVKWSKISINGVPTGASPTRTPYTPEECHAALAAINSTYAALQITQKPSWVRPPTSYSHDSVSSLSVAFEDPDGCKAKALLVERYLYIFGNRATVKKWKQRQNLTKDTANKVSTEHNQCTEEQDVEDVERTLQTATPPASETGINLSQTPPSRASTIASDPSTPLPRSSSLSNPAPPNAPVRNTRSKKANSRRAE